MQPLKKPAPASLKLAFRRAATGDMPRIMEIFAKSFKGQIAEEEQPFYKRHMAEDINNLSAQFTVAVQSGKIVGFTDVEFTHADYSYLGVIGVDPAAQRGGIGKALMAEAEKKATIFARPAMALHVRMDNLAARNFYEKLGYTSRNIEPDFYGDGTSAVMMAKAMKAPGWA